MKKLTTILLFFSVFLTLSRSQEFADGISYQAVALDENGREISETDISVRFSILGSSELAEEHLYQEVHLTDTDVRGLFTVIIGHGTVTESSLTDAPGDIDWGANDLYLAVEIDINNEGEFRLMGVQQMMHVPFAMHAASARSYSMQSGSWHDPEEAVFQVKNSSGEVVFAVYESGVEINVGEGTSKGSRGGFAVGGFSSQKQGESFEYLRVDPGFVGVNIDDITDLDGSKGSRGGFAVGGFSAAKSESPDYINISPYGTEIFLEQGSAKGTRGGFAVGGFSPSKSYLSNDYFVAGGDSVRVYIDDSENDKGSRGGFAVGGFSAAKGEGPEFMRVDPGYLRFSIDQEDDSKGSRGGFAVGGFSSQKGGENDYLSLTPGLAQFAYDTLLAKGSRGGFAVGGFSSQKSDPVSDYLYITADSVRMSIVSPATKSTRGGFAIAERSSAKSPGNDIFYLTPGITEIYTKDGGSKLLGGFTVYGFDEFQQEADLFQVTEHVTTVTTVFAVAPIVSTGEITDITTDSANGGGEVLEDGNADVTGRGLVWGTSPRPRVIANEGITEEADGPGAFTSAVTGLSPGLRYYLRAYATNKAGSGYGEEKVFYTDNIITATSGVGGTIDPEGEIILKRDSTQVFTISPDSGYEIDDVTLGGVSVLGNVSIDEGTGIGTYTFTNNVIGTRTLNSTFRVSSTVEDIEGNVYEVITIGTQVWMAENLRTTTYNFNIEAFIPYMPDSLDWQYADEGAYSVYKPEMVEGIDDVSHMINAYGVLYNWFAVETGELCPVGWRVPTSYDWEKLTDYLVNNYDTLNTENIGNALKDCRQEGSPQGGECDTPDHPRWDMDETNFGTDIFEFSAMPGGFRSRLGGYYFIGSVGSWWTWTASSDEYAYITEIYASDGVINIGPSDKYRGINVRCILSDEVIELATPVTNAPDSIGFYDAILFGTVDEVNGESVNNKGFYWGTDPFLMEEITTNGSGPGDFTALIGDLSPGTTYYFSAYASNEAGYAFGDTLSFTTLELTEGYVYNFAGDLFLTYWKVLKSYNIGMTAHATADQTTISWANWAWLDMSSEPRKEWNNDPRYSYHWVTKDVWDGFYRIIDRSNDALNAILVEGMQINGGADNDKVLATLYLMKGLAHGQLGMVFDKAYIKHHDDTGEPFLSNWNEVIIAGINDLQTAITISDAAAPEFSWGTEVMPGHDVTNTFIAQLASSHAARFLAQGSRNAWDNESLGWAMESYTWTDVYSFAENGLTVDFAPVGDGLPWEGGTWWDINIFYLRQPGWGRVDMRVINLLDPEAPVRYPTDENGLPLEPPQIHAELQPGESQSLDQRFYTDYEFLPDNIFLPERGGWHFSHYRHSRYDNDMGISVGPMYEFRVYENELIKAEALLRGFEDAPGAAAILNDINNPRTVRGNLDPVNEFDGVAVMDAIFYERYTELFHNGWMIHFHDMRRTDYLQYGTPLHFPLPGKILEEIGETPYTYGGYENADGINTSDGGEWIMPYYHFDPLINKKSSFKGFDKYEDQDNRHEYYENDTPKRILIQE